MSRFRMGPRRRHALTACTTSTLVGILPRDCTFEDWMIVLRTRGQQPGSRRKDWETCSIAGAISFSRSLSFCSRPPHGSRWKVIAALLTFFAAAISSIIDRGMPWHAMARHAIAFFGTACHRFPDHMEPDYYPRDFGSRRLRRPCRLSWKLILLLLHAYARSSSRR